MQSSNQKPVIIGHGAINANRSPQSIILRFVEATLNPLLQNFYEFALSTSGDEIFHSWISLHV
jgi:hypothetical protein